ncbi:MAG: cupin domain-containing protein, partial [Halieaceae bacterium]|nr:cupin domain-containing protein [Halieaceae bacterium]
LAAFLMAASGGASAVDVDTLIEALGLEAHVEGGYFRRIFQAEHRDRISTPAGERYTLTSIHYLLTADSPVGHWHLNRSDIVHYFHLGAPITYYLIHPDGRLETVVMGSDVARGQQLALVVRGGTWKASHLPEGDYGLISEAVAPGFEYEDMTLGKRDSLLQQFPQHAEVVERFTRE